MKNIDLDFVTRVKLIGIIGAAPAGDGGIDKLTALQGAYRKAQFTAAEMEHLTVTQFDTPQGPNTRYNIKGFDEALGYSAEAGEDFGDIAIALDDSESVWLLRQLKEWSKYATIHDLDWYKPLVDILEKKDPPREPKHEFRKRRKG